MRDGKKRICQDLTRLGIVAGDSLLVHSSLTSVGRFPNRAEVLVEALLEILGISGTLLMPALSYVSVTAQNPFFDQVHTPSCVGGLTDFFRTFPGVQRSIHPTHSVCSTGKNSQLLLGDHHLDETPCGPYSPFSRLKEVGGKILFLGCGLHPNTSMHAIEELTRPEYLLGEPLKYSISTRDGRVYQKWYTTHDFKHFEQRYDRVMDVLGPSDYKRGQVLEAETYLLDTIPLWEKVNRKLLESPFYFVDKKI